MDFIFEAILEIILDILIIPLENWDRLKARSKIIIISIVIAIILFVRIYLICNAEYKYFYVT